MFVHVMKYMYMFVYIAVIGLVFKQDSLKSTMEDLTRNSHGLYDCGDSESMACYLLDDGAFVIATNQDKFNTSVSAHVLCCLLCLSHSLFTLYHTISSFNEPEKRAF